MAITRKQRWQVFGVNTGLDSDNDEPDLICCPMLDNTGKGEPNFPLRSCLHRQQDEEWKIATCYGGCKGKAPTYTKPVIDPEVLKQRKETCRARIDADNIREQIINMHNQGHSIEKICQEVYRGKSLVEKRLTEAGLITPRGYGPDSLKQSIFAWLDKNPDATAQDVMDEFHTHNSTASSYKAQWNKRRKG